MLSFADKIKLNSDVLMQDLGGEAVFLNCSREEYFALDAVGTRILTLLEELPSVQLTYETLLNEFEVEPERLRQDMTTLIEKLVESGLVQVVET
jgi:hypothetical protein